MAKAAARKRKPKPSARTAPVTDATSAHIESLFATLEQDPNDAATALVLADALGEQQDARAELILVQHAIAGASRDQRDGLRTREHALIHATRTRLLGDLAPQPGVTLDVRHGFVREVRLVDLDADQIETALARVLPSPEARLLDSLVIGNDHEQEIGLGDVFHRLAGEVKPQPALRRLKLGSAFDASTDDRVGEHEYDDEELYEDEDGHAVPAGEDLRGVLAMFPRLRELVLDLGTVRAIVGPLASKHLERFAWISPRLRADELAPLATSVLPALASFELWPGAVHEHDVEGEYEDPEDAPLRVREGVGLATLRPVLAMLDRSPLLRELAFGRYDGSIPKLLDDLRRRELVRRLHVFALAHMEIDDEDADELVDFARAATALRELALRRVYARSSVRQSLERRLGTKLHAKWASEPPAFRYIAGYE